MTTGVIPQMVKCKAKKSNGVEHCAAWAVRGRNVCRVHGGMSPAPGPGHPRWKNGRYSKAVPAELLSRYQMGLSDPGILEMTSEIALLDSRAAQLLERIGSGESGKRWERAREALRAVLSFQQMGDVEMVEESLDDLSKVIFGTSDHETWAEIREVIESRRRVASTERQRLAAAQQNVTVAEMLALVGSLSSVVMSHVFDPDARAAIAEDVRRLLTREGYAQQREALT